MFSPWADDLAPKTQNTNPLSELIFSGPDAEEAVFELQNAQWFIDHANKIDRDNHYMIVRKADMGDAADLRVVVRRPLNGRSPNLSLRVGEVRKMIDDIDIGKLKTWAGDW